MALRVVRPVTSSAAQDTINMQASAFEFENHEPWPEKKNSRTEIDVSDSSSTLPCVVRVWCASDGVLNEGLRSQVSLARSQSSFERRRTRGILSENPPKSQMVSTLLMRVLGPERVNS